jgi:NAD(P)-dependent dehydrogenase (short-subunit alcohol dehydrogenase family)
VDRSVLITGASSGIGAATAARLAARGFAVYGSSRRPPSSTPPGVHWLAMDVCDEESVRRGVAEVLESSPRLGALVCNAGFGIFGSVEEVSVARAQEQFDTNFFGVLRVLRAVLPGMRERGSGRVVLVGSLAGRAPIPFQAHYSATKAATDALALALANELHPHGVRVTLVEPGDIRTEFNERMDWGGGEDSPYAERLRHCEQVSRESLPQAPPPQTVARVVERALCARRPRLRYPVGPDSWNVPLGRRLLPDRWMLRAIRAHFKV